MIFPVMKAFSAIGKKESPKPKNSERLLTCWGGQDPVLTLIYANIINKWYWFCTTDQQVLGVFLIQILEFLLLCLYLKRFLLKHKK